MERQSLAWSDRDLGQKLSIVLINVLAALIVTLNLTYGLQKLSSGVSLSDRLIGAGMIILAVSIGFRVFRWWSARHAR